LLALAAVFDLRWSWLCVPYIVCTAALAAIGVVAALIRGDRVLRLGVIASATTALPWAIGSAAWSAWSRPITRGRCATAGGGEPR
jgi:hypothetical protein